MDVPDGLNDAARGSDSGSWVRRMGRIAAEYDLESFEGEHWRSPPIREVWCGWSWDVTCIQSSTSR